MSLFKKKRNKCEDASRQFYENDIVNVDLSKIKRIDRFEYDCVNFHVIIEDGKLTFTDKETGEVIEKLTGQSIQAAGRHTSRTLQHEPTEQEEVEPST